MTGVCLIISYHANKKYYELSENLALNKTIKYPILIR